MSPYNASWLRSRLQLYHRWTKVSPCYKEVLRGSQQRILDFVLHGKASGYSRMKAMGQLYVLSTIASTGHAS